MPTLLNAYKTAKDNEKQTGTSPCTVPYMREIDEIFAESCLVSNNHTINIGTDPQEALIEFSVYSQEPNAANPVSKNRTRAKERYVDKKIEQTKKSDEVQKLNKKKMKIEEEKLKILQQSFMNKN
ncbi:uncharacterized protein LOC125779667 [Bactrocera dorsalis]|uniref:Uncharacterized protein LOC125779667 n=1 Tax=Bactrocera dorsalis TaxID=27457 RepID=A0ABM3K5Z3_BACDO|nr:uncharacterized protein LOC125779667 [Bactrocera dorsalis]